MMYIEDEIDRCIEESKLSVSKLSLDLSQKHKQCFISSFGENRKYRYPLWEHLDENFNEVKSKFDDEAWRKIPMLIANMEFAYPIFLFTDDGKYVYQIESTKDLAFLLGETPHFEFYIVNEANNKLICLNDHDFIIQATCNEQDTTPTLT